MRERFYMAYVIRNKSNQDVNVSALGMVVKAKSSSRELTKSEVDILWKANEEIPGVSLSIAGESPKSARASAFDEPKTTPERKSRTAKSES